MFAIIKTGGKQYKITQGEILKIEDVNVEKGKDVTFDQVLVLSKKGKTDIGKPLLKNVSVVAKVLENKKDKKILVFKKRRRHNSRRLNGHRQNISVVQISNISIDGKPITIEKKKISKPVEKKTTDITVNKTKQPIKDVKDGT